VPQASACVTQTFFLETPRTLVKPFTCFFLIRIFFQFEVQHIEVARQQLSNCLIQSTDKTDSSCTQYLFALKLLLLFQAKKKFPTWHMNNVKVKRSVKVCSYLGKWPELTAPANNITCIIRQQEGTRNQLRSFQTLLDNDWFLMAQFQQTGWHTLKTFFLRRSWLILKVGSSRYVFNIIVTAHAFRLEGIVVKTETFWRIAAVFIHSTIQKFGFLPKLRR